MDEKRIKQIVKSAMVKAVKNESSDLVMTVSDSLETAISALNSLKGQAQNDEGKKVWAGFIKELVNFANNFNESNGL